MPRRKKLSREKIEAELKKQRIKASLLKKQLKELKDLTKKQIVTLMTSSFGFVAALFWRDAVQSMLQQVFGLQKATIWTIQFALAIAVTLLAVLVTFFVTKTLGKE